MSRILVIDLGTRYFKFALLDRQGQLCGLARLAPPTRSAQPGRLEIDAPEFVRQIKAGLAALRSREPEGFAQVEAMTFATQTNSFLLLDQDHRPLTPLILWSDRRAAELGGEIAGRARPGDRSITGVPEVGHESMAAKLLWLARHEPALYDRARHLCLISDYLTLLLSGKHVTEAGAAGLTGLLDIHTCRWAQEMLERWDVPRPWLPEVARPGTDLGPIARAVAAEYGLPKQTRFVMGCLDQYAGAIGLGNVRPGSLSETTGTVLATVGLSDRFGAELTPAVFQGPSFAPGWYWRMAFGEVAANWLQWYRDLLTDRPPFGELLALAAEIEPGAEGLRLAADAAPTVPEAVFRAWGARHGRGHAVRCILEAVARALRDQVAVVADGAMPEEIRSAGGAACSRAWLQIKADILGIPVRATRCEEPTSLGAAILAEAALTGASVPEIADRAVDLEPVHDPDPERHAFYQQLGGKK